MITSSGKAQGKLCPLDIGHKNGNCKATDCMAWQFYVPPPGITMDKKAEHGIKDRDKKGYCGLALQRI